MSKILQKENIKAHGTFYCISSDDEDALLKATA